MLPDGLFASLGVTRGEDGIRGVKHVILSPSYSHKTHVRIFRESTMISDGRAKMSFLSLSTLSANPYNLGPNGFMPTKAYPLLSRSRVTDVLHPDLWQNRTGHPALLLRL